LTAREIAPRRTSGSKTPEGKIKAKIKKLLDSYGERLYYFMPVPTGYGKRSVDYLCCVDGLFFAIEAKRPGAKPTAYQEITLQQIRFAGGTVFVINGDGGIEALRRFVDYVVIYRGQHDGQRNCND
jgi:hypothetical protein